MTQTVADLYKCEHCGYPDMRGKRYGWLTCYRCHARVCSGCLGPHERKHEEQRERMARIGQRIYGR